MNWEISFIINNYNYRRKEFINIINQNFLKIFQGKGDDNE